MAHRVDLTARAVRDLRRLYQIIHAEHVAQARDRFAGLERVIVGLDEVPARGTPISENTSLHRVLYGRGRNVYRITYAIDESSQTVTVLHIRHGARDASERDADTD